jgi:hypothetical protein
VNRQRKKGECQSPDFNLLSGFLLKIGDQLGPVAIHFKKGGSYENKRDHKYRGNSNYDPTCPAVHGHSNPQNTVVFGAMPASNRWSDRR